MGGINVSGELDLAGNSMIHGYYNFAHLGKSNRDFSNEFHYCFCHRHYIMASSNSAIDKTYPLAAICDLLPKINKNNTWKEIRKQISITTSLIEGVRRTLL